MKLFKKVTSKLKYWLLTLFLLPVFFVWMCMADDLMEQIMEPAYQAWTTIDVWKSVNRVWKKFFEWSYEVNWDLTEWLWVKKSPSLIVKVTKILLSLVIALSVTMILYNGLIYIVQTWQWKEWKDLVTNLVYIVIWILLSLFSVTIITVLQSVSNTLDKETTEDWNQKIDEQVTDTWEKQWRTWREIWNLFKS